MNTSYEKISKNNASSQGKPDSNLSNDSNHLGGISAEEYATKKYVQDYHDNKEQKQKEYIDNQDTKMLEKAKEYANSLVRNQDFSDFAKNTDINALDEKLSNEISSGLAGQQSYTDNKVKGVVDDVNNNFESVNTAINNLNTKQKELFQSVSDGKKKIAGAITDKGVTTSANDTFDTMAINIGNIKTGSSGEIPEGYVDTRDATADASKILNGYSAYANGKKLYGTLKTPNDYEENPNNPYPTGATVDLVYGVKSGEFKNNICYNSYPGIFAISCDKRIMAEYDSTNKKIIMRVDNGTGVYVVMKNQEGTLLTPEYTLSDLGIELNDDLEISCMEFSVMNSDTNFSAYDCNLAIGVRKKSNTITNQDVNSYYIYVYKVHTLYGNIKKENKEISFETDGKVNTTIELNCYKIVSSSTEICGLLDMVFSSSDSMKLVVISSIDIKVIKLLYYRTNSQDFYELAILATKPKLSSIKIKQFINNSRIVVIATVNDIDSSYRWESLYVLDETNNIVLKNTGITLGMIFSENALHGTDGSKLYNVTVNYKNGNISLEEITLLIPSETSYDSNYSFDKTARYLLYTRSIGYNSKNIKIYEIDEFSDTGNIACIYNKAKYSANNGYIYKTLPDYKTFINSEDGKITSYYSSADEKRLIGLRYNGQMFYSNIYDAGVLTAKQENVKKGCTFIGYNGLPEAGTMEVTQ